MKRSDITDERRREIVGWLESVKGRNVGGITAGISSYDARDILAMLNAEDEHIVDANKMLAPTITPGWEYHL